MAFTRDPALPILAAAPAMHEVRPQRTRHHSPWHPRWLLAAPHRLGFFAAACMLALAATWWSAMLGARALGLNIPWSVPAPAAHALLMTLGFLPLFMVGFLFTAGPKWLAQPEVAAQTLRLPVAGMVLGWLVAVCGFHASQLLAGTGVALVALGWTRLWLMFLHLVRSSRAPDRVHAGMVLVACGLGVAALWTASGSLALGQTLWLRSATQLALWWFVATVFAVVAHRMLPFFSAAALPLLDAWRPMWLLWALVGLMALQGPLAVADLWLWPLPSWAHWLQAGIKLPAAALLLWLALRWGLIQSMKIRLLAMLHAGFLWLGLALALDGVSHVLMALTQSQVSLGLAPTHALSMGYLGGTLLAMATRVSSGHSGRPLAADNPVWLLYGLLHVATLGRVLGALWPAQGTPLVLGASLIWCVVCVGWALRYGNWFGRIRVDGKPG